MIAAEKARRRRAYAHAVRCGPRRRRSWRKRLAVGHDVRPLPSAASVTHFTENTEDRRHRPGLPGLRRCRGQDPEGELAGIAADSTLSVSPG